MTDKLKSSLNILSRIIFYDETDIFNNEFYHDEKLLSEGYRFVRESKPNMFFEAYVRFPDTRNQDVEIINFEKYKSRKLKSLFADIELEIKEIKYSDKKSLKNILIEVYDELIGIFNKAVKDDRTKLVEQILVLRDTLKFKYSQIVEYHRFYDIKVSKMSLTQGLFQPKEGLKTSFFIDLYFLLIDHRAIDSENISQESFTNTLTSPIPHNKIQFTVNNYLIVYILDQLKYFFHTLTTSTVGDSKLFLNKQGKTLLAGDLNTARTRGEEKEVVKKELFQVDFDLLKETYPV